MAVKKITIINRKNKTFEVSDRKPLLQELRAQGVDLPYGCEYGGCITCAAKLINGEVDQRSQVALNNRQINNGYVVLCCLLYTSPSPRDLSTSRMPSSA